MGMKGHPAERGGCGWMKMAMLAVVILVGVMGVMKVRDRRLFNLAIKDKDRQIISLHLLLQKERQYAKESKRKNQDLNAKLYSLRTQKNDLNNKIMVMQSTIGSIKDEQRALEIAIQDKQNEIIHKDSQIKDLTSIQQTPPKIWSLTSDDASNRQLNLTTTKTSSWFGLTSNEEKLKYQQNIAEGEVPKPKDEDTGKLATSKEGDLTPNYKGDMKTEVCNTIEGRQVTEENGNGLSVTGRRSFIVANESQTNAPTDKRQLKEKREEGVTEVTRSKSINYSTEAFLRAADRKDEDEAEIETDTNSSTESTNGSEADQDYKEETED